MPLTPMPTLTRHLTVTFTKRKPRQCLAKEQCSRVKSVPHAPCQLHNHGLWVQEPDQLSALYEQHPLTRDKAPFPGDSMPRQWPEWTPPLSIPPSVPWGQDTSRGNRKGRQDRRWSTRHHDPRVSGIAGCLLPRDKGKPDHPQDKVPLSRRG